MPAKSYKKSGLVLKRGSSSASKTQIKDLQKDLRQLGYLFRWIDGGFGLGTERAILTLQHNRLDNHGQSANNDEDTPLSLTDHNGGRVNEVTGIADQKLAQCISDKLKVLFIAQKYHHHYDF
jgi:hypothetical protein